MSELLPNGKQQYLADNGLPLVGGMLYTYATGTLNPLQTTSDAAGLIPNPNPVILDARGEAIVFWSGAYDVTLKDALGNLIWTVSNVDAPPPFVLTPVMVGEALYPRTPAEIAAEVTPTNYTIPSHLAIASVLLERYGGVPDGVTPNDAAMVSAALVAGQFDGVILLNAGTWAFGNGINLGAQNVGARLVGAGAPILLFSGLSATTDCLTCTGYLMRQVEVRNITLSCQNTGRDGLVLAGSNMPIIDNVYISNPALDGLLVQATGTNYVEKLTGSVRIQSAGRHGVAYSINGSGGAFINELNWTFVEVRGVSKNVAGGAALYYDSNGTGAGSTLSNHQYQHIEFDAQYTPTSSYEPSLSPVYCDGTNGRVQGLQFLSGGVENTGGYLGPTGNFSGASFIHNAATGYCNGIFLGGCIILGGWCGLYLDSTIQTPYWIFDYADARTTFAGAKLTSVYSSPLPIESQQWYENDAVAGTALIKTMTKLTAPASQTDGVPLDGQLHARASIGTSATGNLDFLQAIRSSVPITDFVHTFILHLAATNYPSIGPLIMRGYQIIVYPDLATTASVQIWDASSANEIASVTFSVVGTTLRASITTGTAHGTGGGSTAIYGTLVRGAFL